MEQKRIAGALKGLTVFVGLVLALVFFWYLPLMGQGMALMMPEVAYLYWPCLLYVWAIGVLCGLALWRFWTVCTHIGRGESFSQHNARAFSRIGNYAVFAGFLLALLMVCLAVIRCLNGAWLLLLGFLIFVCAALAVLCFCLSRLISHAAELKDQSDLTI